MDRFVKNTAEILSPLHETTALHVVTAHAFLTPDRKVQRTVFGSGQTATIAVVNASTNQFPARSLRLGEVVLPPYGFLVDGPSYAAFCALEFNGLRYEKPALFTVRATHGGELRSASEVRVFHGFGDPRLRWRVTLHEVEKEAVLKLSSN
jgi:hypothetical protein